MLDGKVLAAVFATLTAIGAAMNGGAVDSADLQPQNIEKPGGFDVKKYIPNSLSFLQDLQQNPEPTHDIKANLKVEGLQSQSIRIKDSSVRAQNVTSAKINNRKVASDEDIVFYGFTGEILPGKPSFIEGQGRGFLTSGVNVSGGFSTKQKLETKIIEVKDVKRAKISLTDITGSIESNSTSARIRDSGQNLEISSFSGNISVNPENSTVELSGKIAKLTAGDISFGN